MRKLSIRYNNLEVFNPAQSGKLPILPVFVVCAVIALFFVFDKSPRKDRNDILASSEPTISDEGSSCSKSGINLAAGFDFVSDENVSRAEKLGMGWVLALAVDKEDAVKVADSINKADSAGLKTIVRICFDSPNDDDPYGNSGCHFQSSADYLEFLKNVNAGVQGKEFFAIAGPNEPMDENWLPGTTDIPRPIPENDEQYARIAAALSKYMNEVIAGVKGDPGMSNIKLLSPAFNFARFDSEKLMNLMADAQFDRLDGIAGNVYNTSWTTITTGIQGYKDRFPNHQFYLTETGWHPTNKDFELLKSEIKKVKQDDQISAFLFFNAFDTNNPTAPADGSKGGFKEWVMTDRELAEVIGIECSRLIDDSPYTGGMSDLVEACPFDDFPQDLVSCDVDKESIGSAKEVTEAANGCGEGTALCGEIRIEKCGTWSRNKDGTGAGSTNCSVPDDGRWHMGYEVTTHIEQIPVLGYLQSAVSTGEEEGRTLDYTAPCYDRNASGNTDPNIDFAQKFDGRIGLYHTSTAADEQVAVPVLGTAAGCLFYNHKVFWEGSEFNKISSGFVVGGADRLVNDEDPNVGGILDSIFDVIGPVASKLAFAFKGLFSGAPSEIEIILDKPFCEQNSKKQQVTRLLEADTLQISRTYESSIEKTELSLSDSELCDRYMNGSDIKDDTLTCVIVGTRSWSLGNPGASVSFNGKTLTQKDVFNNLREGKNEDGTAVLPGGRQEVTSVQIRNGGPFLVKEVDPIQKIDMDGMLRAIASAYVEEMEFFRGLGCASDDPACQGVDASTPPRGYRVIHNINSGIEIPVVARLYDTISSPRASSSITDAVSSISSEESTCVDVNPKKVGSYDLAGHIPGGSFRFDEEGPYHDKPAGRSIYVIPWLGQIPRMYGRIVGVNSDFSDPSSGNTEDGNLDSDILKALSIGLCKSEDETEDCLVPYGNSMRDPLFDFLSNEGAFTPEELKIIEGLLGYKTDPINQCSIPVCSITGSGCNEFNCFAPGADSFIGSLNCASNISYFHNTTDRFIDTYGPFCDNETYVKKDGTPNPLPYAFNFINFYDEYMSGTGAARRNSSGSTCTTKPPATARPQDVGMGCGGEFSSWDKRQDEPEYDYYRGALRDCSIPISQTYWTSGNTFGYENDPIALADYLMKDKNVTYNGFKLSNTPREKVISVLQKAKDQNINPFILLGNWATESWFGQSCATGQDGGAQCDIPTTSDEGTVGGIDSGTESAKNIKILPIGDSITNGATCEARGGYRQSLDEELKKQGIEADFVGPLSTGEFSDPEHAGFNGEPPAFFIDLVGGWVDKYDPDIVLIHLGTNGLNDNVNEGCVPLSSGGTQIEAMKSILNQLKSKDVQVVVSTIIERHVAAYQCDSVSHAKYNQDLLNLINSGGYDNVVVVKMDNNYLEYPGDYGDAVHPSCGGYEKMSDKWLDGIKTAMGIASGNDNDTEVNICTEEGTESNSDEIRVYSGTCNEIFNAIKREQPYAGNQGVQRTSFTIQKLDVDAICIASGGIKCKSDITTWCATCPAKANLLFRHELNHIMAGRVFFDSMQKTSEFAADATSLNGGWYKFEYEGQWGYATDIRDDFIADYILPRGLSASTFISYLWGDSGAKAILDAEFSGSISRFISGKLTNFDIVSTPPPDADCNATTIGGNGTAPGNNDNPGVNTKDAVCPVTSERSVSQWNKGPTHSLCWIQDQRPVDINGVGNSLVVAPVTGRITEIRMPWEEREIVCNQSLSDDDPDNYYDGGIRVYMQAGGKTYAFAHLEYDSYSSSGGESVTLNYQGNSYTFKVGTTVQKGAPLGKLYDGRFEDDPNAPDEERNLGNYSKAANSGCWNKAHLHFYIVGGNTEKFVEDFCGIDYNPNLHSSYPEPDANYCCLNTSCTQKQKK